MTVSAVGPKVVHCGEYRHIDGTGLRVAFKEGRATLSYHSAKREPMGGASVVLLNAKGYQISTYPRVIYSSQETLLAAEGTSALACICFIILGCLAAVAAYIIWRCKKPEVAQWTAVGSASCFALALLIWGPVGWCLKKQSEKRRAEDEARHAVTYGPPNFEHLSASYAHLLDGYQIGAVGIS